MNPILIMLAIIALILAASKIAMNQVKKEDRRQGLELKDKNYSLKGTLLSSSNQDKRIEKNNKETFHEYKINESLWKKAMIVLIGSAIVSITYGFTARADFIGPLMLTIAGVYVYYSKKIRFVIFTDILTLLVLFTNPIKYLVPILIMVPAIIILNFVTINDYIAYRRYKRELEDQE